MSADQARQPAGAPTGGQFAATSRAEAATTLTTPDIPVHEFGSTGSGYNRTQVDDAIRDGDVLAVPSEGVYGFLYEAWPVAVTAEHGQFHAVADMDAFLADNPQYAGAVAASRAMADAAKEAAGPTPQQQLTDLVAHCTPDELDAVCRRLGQLRHHAFEETITAAARAFAPEHREEGEVVLRRLAELPSENFLATALAHRVRTERTLTYGSPYRRR